PVPAAVEPEKPAIEPASNVAAKVPATPAAVEKSPEPSTPSTTVDWPGFRGLHRDDIVAGVRIKTDWNASPPVAIWRRAVGPGWSSFAVHNGVLFTQEQRGPEEVVSCYSVTTGKPVWSHSDKARFWESNAGAGPRGTPTFYNGRLYTVGGTGIVNALDARNGAVIWSHNAASETGTQTPDWGFSSSPLVVDDMVLVAVSGHLVAYDAATGASHWAAPARGASYSSPHLATIDGVKQVLLLSGQGLASFAPADGTLLWEHSWKGYPIVQPALTEDGNVLISVTD